MADDDLRAVLAEWGDEFEEELSRAVGDGESLKRSLTLVAAVEEILKQAGELAELRTVPPSGELDEAALLGIHWCAAKVRQAITALVPVKTNTEAEETGDA
jgi:hypothetical protein